MYEVYGDHLYYKRQFMDAALGRLPFLLSFLPALGLIQCQSVAFHLADNRSRAMKAYEKAHAWKEFFTLALTSEPAEEPEVILELCEKIANDLATRGRHVEAGRVWLDYGDNVEEAVAAFSRGRDFAEAYRIVICLSSSFPSSCSSPFSFLTGGSPAPARTHCLDDSPSPSRGTEYLA